MPISPYFLSEALRQRYQHNLQAAQAEQRVTEQQFTDLHALGAAEQPMVEAQACVIYRLVLEDGSPESLAMATTLVIEHGGSGAQVLFADTLFDGLMRFTSREQLNAYARKAFSVTDDQNPAFELQRVEGCVFESRMWQVIDQQARTLRWLAADLQTLPSLSRVLDRVLSTKIDGLWSGGDLDLHSPLVQVVQRSVGGDGAHHDVVVRLHSVEDWVLGLLTARRTPAGQHCRLMSSKGQALDRIDLSRFEMQMSDLKNEYEHLLEHYWTHPDQHGLTRRLRFAQALADVFSHHVLMLQSSSPLATQALARITASPLYQPAPVPVSRLSMTVDNHRPWKLASLYLIHLEQGAYALYSPLKGVRQFKDRQALDDLLNNPAGLQELRHYLSLDDDERLPDPQAETRLHVHDYPLDKPLFYDCIDAIIGLQQRNLNAALKRRCQDAAGLRGMLDDALDVRALIDGRLPDIDGGGRWLRQLVPFTAAAEHGSAPLAPLAGAPAPSWGEQFVQVEQTLRDISSQFPSVEMLARQILSPYLAALGYPAPSEGQNIQLMGNEQRAPRLTDLVLERVSGARATIPPDSKVQLPAEHRGAFDGWESAPVQVLDAVVSRVATVLLAGCTARFEAFYDQPLRTGHAQIQVNQTHRTAREQLLRLELAVARFKGGVSSSLLDLLQICADRPLSNMRSGSADIHAIEVTISDKRFLLGLDVAWVLRAPDEVQPSGLVWTPFTGLKAMASGAALQVWLQTQLTEPDLRAGWLSLFPGADRQWLDEVLADGAAVTLRLERVEGDFLARMQQDSRKASANEIMGTLLDARQQRLGAEAFSGCMSLASSNDWLLGWLDHVSTRAANGLLIAAMPGWVTQAEQADLEGYIEHLKDYFRRNDPEDDFLAGVPAMRFFARQRVLEALQRDFPGHALDPDTLTVTTTHYVIAPVPTGDIPVSVPGATLTRSESLVDFSLNHFSQVLNGVLSVGTPVDTPAPKGLNGLYVARLVHTLDVGRHYQALLAARFAPNTQEYTDRRERFMRQVPSRLMVTVMELKMQRVISQTAVDYIAAVLEMPDHAARLPVQGQPIVLRSLALVARKGMAADAVDGFFLIGPQDAAQGPLVLHIHFSEQFSFREFRNHDHLLEQLRLDADLQKLLLSRLAGRVRDRYDNGGLLEAHIPFLAQGSQWIFETTLDRPEKVSLDTPVVTGNALRYLYEAIVKRMRDDSCTQSVTSAQADWSQFVHLMGMLFDVAVSFVPGRLGWLISLWQSGNLMRESVSAATGREWGAALTDFTLALGALASTRRVEIEPMRTRLLARSAVFSWRASALAAEVRQRLRLLKFEVLDVELSSLRFDVLHHVYEDTQTRIQYAAVEGKVYRVQRSNGVWRIKGQTRQGPRLRLDSDGAWQLEPELELGGGKPLPGPGLSQGPSEQAMRNAVDTIITVRAEGIQNIRLYSREQARKIAMARFHALGYLKNALFNLNAPVAGGMAEPVQRLLNGFFGVEALTPQMIDTLRQRLNEVFVGLSESSLAPLSSSRFVLGLSKSGQESTAAFVIAGDVRRRIYLSDLFFTPPDYHLKDQLPGHRAFNANDHFRASTLIHEMSHQVSGAVDFAYLEAAAPSLEMLDVSLPGRLSFKQRLHVIREQALSHRTPADQLFRIKGRDGWRPLQPADARLFGKLSQLTGQQTLEGARQAFLNDPAVRSRVILANADSIAMLANLLGRERFQ